MTDVPAERPAIPRRDPGAADIDTQVGLGWVEPQPEPELPAPPAPIGQPEQ
ncbi:hypothetical protein [Streptomyces sp. NPDC013171]|uniref:hypothetical protein n=1 Tax=Streptomyces sp. NPDC013171 TaxID=3364863 RepID=UPI00369BB097